MRRSLPTLVLAAVLIEAACSGPEGASTVDTSTWASQIENGLAPAIVLEGEDLPGWSLVERMAFHQVPGVSIAIIENGELAWAHAWGVADKETGAHVTAKTLFQAASISKPVGALAALSLVEEGRLALDSPVNDYLKTWTVPDNAFTADSAVTLRGILTHSAGTTVWGFPGYRKDEPFSTDQLLATNAQVLDGLGNTDTVRVYKVPGTSWQYSGGGYTIMEQTLEDITGQAFPDIVAARVLGPAGMARSTYEQPLPEARWTEAARGHRGDGIEVEGEWHTYPEQAAAGLWTTPTDLARVSVQLLGILAGDATDGVLSKGMLEQMLTPNHGGAEGFNDWGLGFGVAELDGHASFGHGGANEGFRAMWTVLPDLGVGFVIMTNGDRGGALANEIARSIAGSRGWPVLRPESKPRVRLDAAEIAALSGQYDLVGIPDFVVEFRGGDNGELQVVVPGQGTMVFYATSADEWFDLADGDVMTIERDENGTVTGAVNDGTTRMVKRQSPTLTPAEDVVRAMHDRYGGSWYESLTFKQKTTTYAADGSVARLETWFESMRMPGMLRIDVEPIPSRILMFRNDTLYAIQGGESAPPRPLVHGLLLMGFDVYHLPVSESLRKLTGLGVDLTRMHESTWQGRDAWVIGAEAGDVTSSQFWIDKERLLFVRQLNGANEVQFNAYERLGNAWISPVVAFFTGGRQTTLEEYSDIHIGMTFEDGVFDPVRRTLPVWISGGR